MEPARVTFWNVPHWAEVAQYVLGGLTVAVFLLGLYWRVGRWRLGKPEPCREPIAQRLNNLMRYGLFQWRLASDPFSTVMHLSIFWGMVVLAIGTALATIDWDVTRLFFGFQFLRGTAYCVFELALDVFGIVLLLGLTMAAFRRYLVRPDALQMTTCRRDTWNSAYLIGMLLLIVVTGFLAEGLRIETGFQAAGGAGGSAAPLTTVEQAAVRNLPAAAWAPLGLAVAKLLGPLPSATLQSMYGVVWWVHALAAFGFIASVPLTKAFHLISSPLNIFFADVSWHDRLATSTPSGVGKLGDFTWRQLLQVDACTWCGKCLDACPMGEAGVPHPTCSVIQRLQVALDGATSWTEGRAKRAAAMERSIVAPEGAASTCAADAGGSNDGTIAAHELWSCCMCRACEVKCPVLIEHPRIIVDLRRRLVDEGRVDEGLQDALMKLNRYGNSFGQSARKRSEWTKGLGFSLKDAAKEEVEYLWFVGDYASYDVRCQQVTRAVATLFNRLRLDVGILYDKEQDAGNDVRRIGEEGLFDLLRERNVKVLGKASFKRIVTTDPHTYNTLKNEYQEGPQQQKGPHPNPLPEGEGTLAGKPVLHYTELLDELLRDGRLKLERPLNYTVTYHDPCYLGRFNGVYDAPRRVLRALGVKLVEMPRHGRNSFCCGGGGGRIWMKDTPNIKERPAENRVKEALALPGVQCLAVACPKDLVMFQDAVKTVGAEGRLRVADLAELVHESLGISLELPAEVAEPIA